MRYFTFLTAVAVCGALFASLAPAGDSGVPLTEQSIGCGGATAFQILHFTKTNGFDHQTREVSAQLFSEIGQAENFTIVDSESASVFDDLTSLLGYEVIVFSNTSGNNLFDANQRANIEAYIAAGGSFLGLHAATDTYRNQSWPFYNQLVGGIVQSSPNHTSQNYVGTMDVIGSHPSTANVPNPWQKEEEYYYWELNGGQLSPDINETLRVRSTGDESYDAPRPMAWYQEFSSGARSYYTALGHKTSNYTDPDNDFRQLLRDALCWCVGASATDEDGGGDGGGTGEVEITGELRAWHRVALNFTGPNTHETATPNPFSDYRLEVAFTHAGDGTSYTVPGFFAADGMAAESSADAGDQWRVYFAPDRPGDWNYSVSFATGPDVAIEGGGASAGFMDGRTGSFTVAPTDKTGRDHRGKGRLEYVGEHYLRYAGTGEWFVKAGADAPENTLAYEDFDDVPNKNGRRKSWQPHAQDYSAGEAGSYTWQNGKGSELLGVVRYLSDKGVNAMSFLTFSLQGDDKNVFPHRLTGSVADFENTANNWEQSVYQDRFDVSRLDQWERIFAYADQKGVYLHFKLQESENDQLMDGGNVGRERKLYYRELIARFAHHLALNWNMGEENTQTYTQRQQMAAYFAQTDPYGHNRVIHTFNGEHTNVYGPLLGSNSDYTGASMQTQLDGYSELYDLVLEWVQASAAAGKKWIVALDEPGSGNIGVNADPLDRKLVRHRVVWATFMAGGAGTEFYYGYQTGCSDLNCEDHRTRDEKYTDAAYALHFFQTHFQNYLPNVVNADALTSDDQDYVLAAPGQAYAVYRPTGGATAIDLPAGTWQVNWYNPRDGSLGPALTLSNNSLQAPDNENDWTALITLGDCAEGVACNDGNPCTVDDTWDADCNCTGIPATDSDGDGVCDAEDQCPGFDDTQDADGDGIPDGCDDCDGTLAGTPCDDGDPQTSNDQYNAACECAGTPPASANDYWLEAECAEYGAQWAVRTSLEASTQAYLLNQATSSSTGSPPADPAFHVKFTVNVATAGTYRIFARTIAENGDGDSFWVKVNAGAWIKWNKINYPYAETGWVWEQVGEWTGGNNVTPLTFQLAAGSNTVTFAHREPNTPLDKLLITLATDAPAGLGGIAVNCVGCGGNPGDACDDGDPCTINDVLDADCNCVGTFADSDGDGVCDAEDQCPGFDDTQDADGDGIPDGCDEDDCDGTSAGTPCDDGDPCTINDVLDADCNCAGQLADSDGDGVCDAEDQCPGFDDTQDTDGDGIPDGCDDCDGTLAGTPCDDGDPQTSNDQYNAACECAGTPIATANDYWLEAECAEYGAQWAVRTSLEASTQAYLLNQATSSSTGSPPADPAFHVKFTVNVATAGTYRIFARTIAENGDGDSFWVKVNAGAWIKWNKINYPYAETGWVWEQVGEWTGGNNVTPLTFQLAAGSNTVTFAHREPNTPLDKLLITLATDAPAGLGGIAVNCVGCGGNPGDACDDGNACTENDVLDADCNCVGTFADSDGDGVCDAEDQCPGFDDNVDSDGDGIPDGCDDCDATLAGTACDDGDPSTTNDQLDANCICSGQPAPANDDYWLEAECATYGNNWTEVASTSASGGNYLISEVDVNYYSTPPSDPDFRIRFTPQIATAGTYRVYARVIVQNPEDNSLWVRANEGAWMKWNQIGFPNDEAGWFWEQVGDWNGGDTANPVTFDLPAGANTIDVVHREPNLPFDKLLITLATDAPVGLGADAENCPDSGGQAKAAADVVRRAPRGGELTISEAGRLYPNPALDRVTLSELPEPVRNLQLLDAWGRMQRHFPDEETLIRTLDLSDLPKGVYILRGQVGGQARVWRVVLQ